MSAVNTCFYIGNLVENPKTKDYRTKKGEDGVLVNVSIGVNSGKDQPAEFVPLTFYGDQAARLAKWAKKGSLISVVSVLVIRLVGRFWNASFSSALLSAE